MPLRLNQILTIVRTHTDLRTGFDALRTLGNTLTPSPVWNKIPTPTVEADLLLATAWLTENLADRHPTGVYFGLDSLNENEGLGSNLEIGMTNAANPDAPDHQWTYALEHYGQRHLIDGLYNTHRALQKRGLDSSLPTFLFFFGYSGLLLAAALERLAPPFHCRFIWGFHDGDLASLARSTPTTLTRLATLP
jgi:hypothetical protein